MIGDALVADLAPPCALRCAAFGLRQSPDTAAAFAGPLLATVLMPAFANDFRLAFWIAMVPGLLAVPLLALGVDEPPRRGYWRVVALWGLHMGMTQGLIAAMVADTAPEDPRGTASGV